jgi:protease I
MRKRAFVVISFNDFKDEEYFLSKDFLISNKIKVITVSDKKGVAVGFSGGEARVNLKISEIELKDFDYLIYIGGPGFSKHLDNEDSYNLLRLSFKNKKIIGAMSESPIILAKSGILENIKATVWSSSINKSGVKILKDFQAIFKEEDVVVDRKIITSSNSEKTLKFMEAILGVDI